MTSKMYPIPFIRIGVFDRVRQRNEGDSQRYWNETVHQVPCVGLLEQNPFGTKRRDNGSYDHAGDDQQETGGATRRRIYSEQTD